MQIKPMIIPFDYPLSDQQRDEILNNVALLRTSAYRDGYLAGREKIKQDLRTLLRMDGDEDEN